LLLCSEGKLRYGADIIAELQNSGQRPFAQMEGETARKLASVFDRYQRELKWQKLLDFDDLLHHCLALVHNNPTVSGRKAHSTAYLACSKAGRWAVPNACRDEKSLSLGQQCPPQARSVKIEGKQRAQATGNEAEDSTPRLQACSATQSLRYSAAHPGSKPGHCAVHTQE
jgi:hypothetical protein